MAIFTGDNWGEPPVGSVLQVTGVTDIANTTYGATQDWNDTGLIFSITPKFSNSLIIIEYRFVAGTGDNNYFHTRLLRNGSLVGANDSGGRNGHAPASSGTDFSNWHKLQQATGMFVDGPGSGTHQYKVQFSTRADEGNKNLRRNEPWETNSNGYNFHGMSTMYLTEIAQ
jgi:hypothetical protein